jgi:hypothetical protein
MRAGFAGLFPATLSRRSSIAGSLADNDKMTAIHPARKRICNEF